MQILSYGGITQSITVPDRHGKLADVVLGFKTLGDYVAKPPARRRPRPGGPYFGEIVGRYGNRIARPGPSSWTPGQTYTLPINNGVEQPPRRALWASA